MNSYQPFSCPAPAGVPPQPLAAEFDTTVKLLHDAISSLRQKLNPVLNPAGLVGPATNPAPSSPMRGILAVLQGALKEVNDLKSDVDL